MRIYKQKILIVEDEPMMLDLLSETLAAKGFEILRARDGNEGLRTALAQHPDLVLLDIIMPNMDGITMLEKLRADEWGKNVPTIILTNLSDSKAIAESLERGVHDYLIKSNWSLEELSSKVKEKLALPKP